MAGVRAKEMFDKFYEENKGRIHMPRGTNYPLNYKKATKWAGSQCDIESREFANHIVNSTMYVSYSQFTNLLKRVCLSYRKNRGGTDVVVILILPFRIKKSNMWVSMLAFEHLRDIIDEVYYDITEVYNNTLNHRSNLYRKKVRCIICDDCAYTGHQLSYIASFDYSWINYPNKPPPPGVHDKAWLKWFDTINRDAEGYISKINIDDFSVDLVIPYMSILAQTRLQALHYVRIPNDCKVFPIFAQQIDVERIPVHILNEFKRTFQYHKDISAIYFDHKIADAVSTFHKVYLLAPLFNCSVQDMRVGFIENCGEEKIPDNIKVYDHYIDLEPEMGGKACPSSFYKQIGYTFDGKKVDGDAYIFDVFSETGVRIKTRVT